MLKLKSALMTFRDLVRKTGFDIVRYNALPTDLPAEIAETVKVTLPFTMTSVHRMAALCEAVQYVVTNEIPGDIVECGVWKGGSMMAVARTLLQMNDYSRHLYLYDTFEGMPEPDKRDVSFVGKTAKDLMREEEKGDPKSVWCVASLEEVKLAMETVGYDPAKIHYVKGRVEDTIPTGAPERIALLRLDTDWYESTNHEMIHLYPRLSTGGVLILDDYGHWHGARDAVDGYFSTHHGRPLLNRIDYSGRLAIKVASHDSIDGQSPEPWTVEDSDLQAK